MERHQNLLAISGIEDAQTEWQHAAHKVVAVAVHHFTLRIVKAQEELDDDADGHQSYGPSPMAAIEQQSIDDVKLQHQTKEPVRTRPDDVIRIWQYIIEHAQHRNDVERCIVVRARRDKVEHRECYETYYHHLEELQIVIADKVERFAPVDASCKFLARDAVHSGLLFGREMRFSLVFHHQSVSTQKEEYGHTVMAEEREQVYRQVEVHADHYLVQPVNIVLEVLILVLLDNRSQPMAVVMQEDADDGESSQGIACRA